MKMFFVKITGYAPYPITINYEEKASNWATATRRAIAKYVKDYKKRGHKRIKNLSIQVSYATIAKLPDMEGGDTKW